MRYWLFLLTLLFPVVALAQPTPSDFLENLGDVNISSPADKEALTYDNATSTWVNSAITGAFIGGFTQGSVIFADSSGNLDEDNTNLFWDDTSDLLGIGTAVPNAAIDIVTSDSRGIEITSTATDKIGFDLVNNAIVDQTLMKVTSTSTARATGLLMDFSWASEVTTGSAGATFDVTRFASGRTVTGGTVNDNHSTFDIRRTSSHVAGTYNDDGAVLSVNRIGDSSMDSDAVVGIELIMDASSLGDALEIDQNGSGDAISIIDDNAALTFGGQDDASIYYDNTNLVVNPKLVGSGYMQVLGNIKAQQTSTPGGVYVDRTDGGIGAIVGDGSGSNETVAIRFDTAAELLIQKQSRANLEAQNGSGLTNLVEWDADGDMRLLLDGQTLSFGAAPDVTLSWDGTNSDFEIKPDIGGLGKVRIERTQATQGALLFIDGGSVDYTSGSTTNTLEIDEDLAGNGGGGTATAMFFGLSSSYDIDAGFGVGTVQGVQANVTNSGDHSASTGLVSVTKAFNATLTRNGTVTSPSFILASETNTGFAVVIDEDITYDNAGDTLTLANNGVSISIDSDSVETAGTLNATNKGLDLAISSNSAGTVTSYGIFISSIQGDTTYGIWDGSAADWALDADNQEIIFGEVQDAAIKFDGADMVIASQNVTAADELLINDFDAVKIEDQSGGASMQLISQTSGTSSFGFYENAQLQGAFLYRHNASNRMEFITYQAGHKIQFRPENLNLIEVQNDLIIVNEDSADVDFRIESNGEDNLFYVDGGNDLARLGDFDTNYTEVDNTGDVLFVGGAGLAFAGISANDVTATITIGSSGQANKVQITAFDTNDSNNNMTPDHTNDHITVDEAGIYLCTVSSTLDSLAGLSAEFGLAVYKNNGATEFTNLHVHRDLSGGAGGNSGSVSMSGIIDLAASDTIEVWVWNETNTQNIVIDDITMSLVQVGGT